MLSQDNPSLCVFFAAVFTTANIISPGTRENMQRPESAKQGARKSGVAAMLQGNRCPATACSAAPADLTVPAIRAVWYASPVPMSRRTSACPHDIDRITAFINGHARFTFFTRSPEPLMFIDTLIGMSRHSRTPHARRVMLAPLRASLTAMRASTSIRMLRIR